MTDHNRAPSNHRIKSACVICGDECDTTKQHAWRAKCDDCKVSERNSKSRARRAGKLKPVFNSNKRIRAKCTICGSMTHTTVQKASVCICRKCSAINWKLRAQERVKYTPRFEALCTGGCGKPVLQCTCPVDVPPLRIGNMAYAPVRGKAWRVEPMYWNDKSAQL